jgi:hypothetical protein
MANSAYEAVIHGISEFLEFETAVSLTADQRTKLANQIFVHLVLVGVASPDGWQEEPCKSNT